MGIFLPRKMLTMALTWIFFECLSVKMELRHCSTNKWLQQQFDYTHWSCKKFGKDIVSQLFSVSMSLNDWGDLILRVSEQQGLRIHFHVSFFTHNICCLSCGSWRMDSGDTLKQVTCMLPLAWQCQSSRTSTCQLVKFWRVSITVNKVKPVWLFMS